MVVNDGSYASGCVVACSVEPGTMVEAGSTIVVYIAADRDVQITTTPETADPAGQGESQDGDPEQTPAE